MYEFLAPTPLRRFARYDKLVPMHPILLYMGRKGIGTQADFARLVHLSPSYVNDVVRGRAPLGRKGALKIEKATGGVLSVQELLSWEPAEDHAA